MNRAVVTGIAKIPSITRQNDYFCFVSTRHVVFRFINGNRTPLCFYSRPIWAVWLRILLPVMAQAALPYGYTKPVYPKAMLARLEAGHGVDRHVDGEGSHPLTHRIHFIFKVFEGAGAILA